jgi:hypothetical protein
LSIVFLYVFSIITYHSKNAIMKIVHLVATLVVLSVIAFACKKGDTGPAGPAGPAGPQGPIGIAGNANVTQYTFGLHNFATTATTILQVTTTADTTNRSAWFVYLIRSGGNVYPIPGFGLNGSSDYRVFWSYAGGKANFTIARASGVGEEYANIRIIRMYANTILPGGRLVNPSSGPDPRDYYAMCNYYNLPY